MKQCSDSLIFLLIDDTIEFPKFDSQKAIEELFGESIPFTFEEYDQNDECFWNYLEKWESIHRFKVIQVYYGMYDKYNGSVEIIVIYSLDDKYYSISYMYYPDSENVLRTNSKEVKPVEKTVTIIKYVEV